MSEVGVRPEFLRALEDIDSRVGASLPPRLCEMVRLRCSHLNGCSYSIKIHSEALAALGVRPDVLSALARPVMQMRAGLADDAERAALRFAEVLTDAPRGLEALARAEVAKHLRRSQVGELVEVVAITNAWNRVTRGTE